MMQSTLFACMLPYILAHAIAHSGGIVTLAKRTCDMPGGGAAMGEAVPMEPGAPAGAAPVEKPAPGGGSGAPCRCHESRARQPLAARGNDGMPKRAYILLTRTARTRKTVQPGGKRG